MRALTGRGIACALVTNASLLSDALIDELLGAGLESVQVSFNGNDPASYEAHMVGLDFAATQARLLALIARTRGTPTQVYVSAIRRLLGPQGARPRDRQRRAGLADDAARRVEQQQLDFGGAEIDA